MASIAIMIGGAIANVVAFTGGNYLAKYLSGNSAAAMEKERERHDRALEAYQAAYAKYMRDRIKLLDWIATNEKMKEQAKQNFTNTDYAFKLYNQAHPDARMTPPKESMFSDFYQPSEQQKMESYCSWVLARSPWATQPSGSFELFLSFPVNGQQTDKDLLQPRGFLEGNSGHKKIIRSCQGPGRNRQNMACQAGNLASISPRAAAHSSSEIRRANPQCSPPGGPSFSTSCTNCPEGARFTSTR